MVLPDLPPSSHLSPLPQEPLILGISASRKIDKALVDKAFTIKTIENLDAIFDTFMDILKNASSESARLDAAKYLTDRAAGKAVQVVENKGSVAHVLLSSDEVKQRLAHLRGDAQVVSTIQPQEMYAEDNQRFHESVFEEGSEGTSSF